MTIRAESRIWDLLRGALGTRALGIVAELGIADALEDRPRPVTELAHEAGADPDTLHRLLPALASDGVFAETEHGVFENTEASEVLRKGGGWDDFAHLFGGVWHRTAGELVELLKFAGRERDEDQWRALLEAGGFEPVEIADGLIEARCR